ncbi:hypothetical protein BDV59DRAFT_72940 [Aspergillus ambiguus]|uniref:uncharacterized protein n=1 Tax=Aspergillus ambiguus TaxID=176160 RepID=UPI003CCD62BB
MDLDNRSTHGTPPAEPVHIRSNSSATESFHEHPSSVVITTCLVSPLDPGKIVHRVKLRRVLRTSKSQKLTNFLFDSIPNARNRDEKMLEWRNGDGNVFLVGSWL